MRFEIHFEINGQEDYFIIEGEDIEEIKLKASAETDRRGLSEIENNLWSREI